MVGNLHPTRAASLAWAEYLAKIQNYTVKAVTASSPISGAAFEIYPRHPKLGEPRWYWRYRSARGKILADGSQGYKSKFNCQRALKKYWALTGTQQLQIRFLDN